MTKTITIAANVTYGTITQNSRLTLEYSHTGKYYFKKTPKGIHIFSDEESAKKSKNVFVSEGHYFINRLRLGEWYINNDGDTYHINKVSKYGRKIHEQLSSEINTKYN